MVLFITFLLIVFLFWTITRMKIYRKTVIITTTIDGKRKNTIHLRQNRDCYLQVSVSGYSGFYQVTYAFLISTVCSFPKLELRKNNPTMYRPDCISIQGRDWLINMAVRTCSNHVILLMSLGDSKEHVMISVGYYELFGCIVVFSSVFTQKSEMILCCISSWDLILF